MKMEREDLRKKKGTRKKKIIYQILFFMVIFWFIGSSLLKIALGLFINTEIVQIGVIEETYPIEAYILRDETVVIAPATGSIKSKINPGERVGKDNLLFELEATSGTSLQGGKTVKAYAPKSGIVSYSLDGLEQFLQPNNLQELDIRKIEQLKTQTVDNSTLDVVEKGNGFLKIVNNLEGLQLYLEFPADLLGAPIEKRQVLTMIFPQLDREISAPIIDIKGTENTAQVLINMPEMWYSLMNFRTIPIEIVLDRKEGIMIPKKALVEKESGEIGAYLLRKGFVFWQDVEIISQEDESIMIKGIAPLTEIISTPNLVKEGQHIGGGFFGNSR